MRRSLAVGLAVGEQSPHPEYPSRYLEQPGPVEEQLDHDEDVLHRAEVLSLFFKFYIFVRQVIRSAKSL